MYADVFRAQNTSKMQTKNNTLSLIKYESDYYDCHGLSNNTPQQELTTVLTSLSIHKFVIWRGEARQSICVFHKQIHTYVNNQNVLFHSISQC